MGLWASGPCSSIFPPQGPIEPSPFEHATKLEAVAPNQPVRRENPDCSHFVPFVAAGQQEFAVSGQATRDERRSSVVIQVRRFSDRNWTLLGDGQDANLTCGTVALLSQQSVTF